MKIPDVYMEKKSASWWFWWHFLYVFRTTNYSISELFYQGSKRQHSGLSALSCTMPTWFNSQTPKVPWTPTGQILKYRVKSIPWTQLSGTHKQKENENRMLESNPTLKDGYKLHTTLTRSFWMWILSPTKSTYYSKMIPVVILLFPSIWKSWLF